MEKNFLKLKHDSKKQIRMLLVMGAVITLILGLYAFEQQDLGADAELIRPKIGEGSYEQELFASLEGSNAYPIRITVMERSQSSKEAEDALTAAEEQLGQLMLGENQSADAITTDLNLAEELPELGVEVLWTTGFSEYFYADGAMREENRPKEPVTIEVSAILSCQESTRDFRKQLILSPQALTEEESFQRFLESSEENSRENEVWKLPTTYQGKKITWKKAMDKTFLYVGILTVGAVIFLNLGRKNDEKKHWQERNSEFERDYAQVVGKFAMLLSAGLSVRNAWERIVYLYRKRSEDPKIVYEEMNRAFQELQKGVPELQIYEQFGARTGQVHYKKLMALFVSELKHGSVGLLEAMEQEMLEAWEEQKRRTRQQGEKISTKLLLPMMGMLGVVFVMILVPAFLSFQI